MILFTTSYWSINEQCFTFCWNPSFWNYTHTKCATLILNENQSTINTYNYKVITSVSLAAFMTWPIFIPDMCTIGHMTFTFSLAIWFGHASFRNIILFKGTLREIRLTAPTYFCSTHIFARFTGFDCIQTFFHIACLIRTNIAFQASNKTNYN